MSQGQHSTRSRRSTRLILKLLSLAVCAGLAVSVSPSAFAVSTTQLQWDLAGMGYLPFSGIDGAAGPQTTAATKAFQSDACLAADGSDGPQTDAALSAKVKQVQVQAAAGATQDGAFGAGTKSAVQACPTGQDARGRPRCTTAVLRRHRGRGLDVGRAETLSDVTG